jgi:hypothetical protein
MGSTRAPLHHPSVRDRHADRSWPRYRADDCGQLCAQVSLSSRRIVRVSLEDELKLARTSGVTRASASRYTSSGVPP